MIKTCIESMTECKTLGKEALSRIQGDLFNYGTPPEYYRDIVENFDDIAQYSDSMPEIPKPYVPYGPIDEPRLMQKQDW